LRGGPRRLLSKPPRRSLQPHLRLLKNGPLLTITGIRFHDQVINITARPDGRTTITRQHEKP
jgi:hypothetical protein